MCACGAQGSYYLEKSNVSYNSGSVTSVERHSYQTLPRGYGSDTGGCHTDKVLEYVVGRFGPVASFRRMDTKTPTG